MLPMTHAIPTVALTDSARRPHTGPWGHVKSPVTVLLNEHPPTAAATQTMFKNMTQQLQQQCEPALDSAYNKGFLDGEANCMARTQEMVVVQREEIDHLKNAVMMMEQDYKQGVLSVADEMKECQATQDAHSQSMTMSAAEVMKVRRRQPSPGSFSPSLTPSSTRATTRAMCCMCVHCAAPCKHSDSDRGTRHPSFCSACLSARSLACLYLGQNCRVCPK